MTIGEIRWFFYIFDKIICFFKNKAYLCPCKQLNLYTMRQKLSKREIEAINSLDNKIRRMAERMEENDVELHYGNGTAASQLNCAAAALETILQEFL